MAYFQGWTKQPNGTWKNAQGQTMSNEEWNFNETKAREAAEAAANAKGVDLEGRPLDVKAKTLLDEKGNLMAQYQTKFDPNTAGLEEIRKRALATGPSAWQQLALKQQGLEQAGQKDALQRQQAAGLAQARSGLASKMGLSAAAAERLAGQSSRAGMQGLQNIGFQGAQQRGNIGLQDEQQKQQMLMQLPGMENQLAAGQTQAQQWNAAQAINQNTMKNAADLAKYQQQMQGWAAGKQGDIMAQNQGGGKK